MASIKNYAIDLGMFIRNYRILFEIIMIPLLAANLPAVIQTKEAYCAFVLIVMSLYWITDCIPYAITSLLPVVAYPLFGIMSSKQVSAIYFQDILMLYIGGLILAICVEKSNLHKKIAFKVIMLFGSNPFWLLLGIMMITSFLSLWIPNVASASMMLPITIALVKALELKSKKNPTICYINNSEETATIEVEDFPENQSTKKEASKLMKGFLISLTYSASIGGSGSLVGSTPSLVLKGFYDQYLSDAGLNFFTYLIYALPAAFIMVIFSWLILSFLWLPKKNFFSHLKKSKNDELENFIKKEAEKLGPINWEQASIFSLFLILVVLWITRDIPGVSGWGSFFVKNFVTDTTPSILVLLILAAWPKENIFKGKKYEPLITWKVINNQFPWNILLLAGGGLALAEGFEKSGLSNFIGNWMDNNLPNQKEIALLIIIIISLTGTELMSNASMASIMIPVANSLAKKSKIDASYLLLPLTISTSYAFMLPVATPTNAVVFSTDYLEIKDLFISGILLKVLGVMALYLSTLWIPSIFNDTTLIFNPNQNNTAF